jgi:hypothetical protein
LIDGQALRDGEGCVILVDEGIFDAFGPSLDQDGGPVDGSFPELGEVLRLVRGVAGLGSGEAVFQMDEPDPACVILKDSDGILSALSEPIDVELKFYQGRVGVLHEVSEAGGSVDGTKFVTVVVEYEFHALGLRLPPGAVEEIRSFGEAFERGPLIFRDHGTDNVGQAELMGEVKFFFEAHIIEVACDRSDACIMRRISAAV